MNKFGWCNLIFLKVDFSQIKVSHLTPGLARLREKRQDLGMRLPGKVQVPPVVVALPKRIN